MTNKTSLLAASLLIFCLAGCTSSDGNQQDHDSPEEMNKPEKAPEPTENTTTDDGPTEDEPTSGDETDSPDKGEGDHAEENQGDGADMENDSTEPEQKQMAIETLNSLVEDGKEGKVYHLEDRFFLGKTTRTDVYNEIGKPQRQDTFDKYTGSMGQASYDLRYDDEGILVEARYHGTNVERQTNLGGITSRDLVDQLGPPDTKRHLKNTNETNYIYDLGNYEIQFILNEKDTADHVNLILKK